MILIVSRVFGGTLVVFSAAVMGAEAPAARSPSAPIGTTQPAASAGTPLLPEQLEEIFVSACFTGSASLGPEEQSPIALQDLPSDLRRRFGKPASGSVWRLSSTTPTYLYTMTFTPTATTSPKVCGLATQSITIGPAIEFLGARVNGPSLTSLHEGLTGAQWLDAERGYVAAASKIDSFTVLEVKQLSKEQQRRALKIVPTLGIYPSPD